MSEAQCAAASGRLPERQSDAATIEVIDEWGQRRVLTKCADCSCYEGVHDLGAGPEPYWLQASVVERWRDAFHVEREVAA